MKTSIDTFANELNCSLEKSLEKFKNFITDSNQIPPYKKQSFLNGNRHYGSLHYLAIISESDFPIRTILEIGTLEGIASMAINSYFKSADITTIDIAIDKGLPAEISNNKIPGLTFIQMDSNDLRENMPNNYFDLIFVDGDHFNPTVGNDLQYAFDHVNTPGVILIDDYDHGDVKKEVNKLAINSRDKFGTLPWSTYRPDGIAYILRT